MPNTAAERAPVWVAVGVIRQQDTILISRRPQHLHQGGKWEFPGGKVEPKESVTEALCRELDEELGIVPVAYSPLTRVDFDYPEKSVCLDVWTVHRWRGEPHARENQEFRWVATGALREFSFPEANLAIIEAIESAPTENRAL